MKVKKVTEMQSFAVETDGDPWSRYTRYSADCWYVTMGQSDEPVHDCEEIEKAYQEYMITTGKQIECQPSRCIDCDYHKERSSISYYCRKLKCVKLGASLAPPSDCPLEKI